VNRAEKAERIRAILDETYPEVEIPLGHRDPFTLLVAVVLSAQTTDKKVNQVTPALFEAAGTPAEMAALPVAEIKELIREVGLANQKAKSLKGLAEILVEEHGGEVPRSFEALEDLPGVGHKTASVVMTQAFGEPAFPEDTHIHRLAWRWGRSDGTNVVKTENDQKRVFPEESWGGLHLRIIYFGREHCPSLRHDFDGCPICSWAMSGRKKTQERRGAKPWK
jgi:endonuclease-3